MLLFKSCNLWLVQTAAILLQPVTNAVRWSKSRKFPINCISLWSQQNCFSLNKPLGTSYQYFQFLLTCRQSSPKNNLIHVFQSQFTTQESEWLENCLGYDWRFVNYDRNMFTWMATSLGKSDLCKIKIILLQTWTTVKNGSTNVYLPWLAYLG